MPGSDEICVLQFTICYTSMQLLEMHKPLSCFESNPILNIPVKALASAYEQAKEKTECV